MKSKNYVLRSYFPQIKINKVDGNYIIFSFYGKKRFENKANNYELDLKMEDVETFLNEINLQTREVLNNVKSEVRPPEDANTNGIRFTYK